MKEVLRFELGKGPIKGFGSGDPHNIRGLWARLQEEKQEEDDTVTLSVVLVTDIRLLVLTVGPLSGSGERLPSVRVRRVAELTPVYGASAAAFHPTLPLVYAAIGNTIAVLPTRREYFTEVAVRGRHRTTKWERKNRKTAMVMQTEGLLTKCLQVFSLPESERHGAIRSLSVVVPPAAASPPSCNSAAQSFLFVTTARPGVIFVPLAQGAAGLTHNNSNIYK